MWALYALFYIMPYGAMRSYKVGNMTDWQNIQVSRLCDKTTTYALSFDMVAVYGRETKVRLSHQWEEQHVIGDRQTYQP